MKGKNLLSTINQCRFHFKVGDKILNIVKDIIIYPIPNFIYIIKVHSCSFIVESTKKENINNVLQLT